MKYVLTILRTFLKCGLIFILSFIWLRYTIHSIWISFLLAFLISITFEIISFLISRRKGNIIKLKNKELEDAENMFLSLATSNNYIDFFYNLAKSRHKNISKTSSYITIKHENGNITILFPFIKFHTINNDDISSIIKKIHPTPSTKLVIPCNEYERNSLSFSKNFNLNIVILNKYETYKLLYQEYEYFPEITFKYKKEAKKTFSDLLNYSFNKARAKSYIFASLIIFISSFFIKMNIYYCIIASILLLFALFSYINPKYNIKDLQELL